MAEVSPQQDRHMDTTSSTIDTIGRRADQFPKPTGPASNWVEVGPNIGGGITVEVYERNYPRTTPDTYTVATAGMSVGDARALAARLIEHADFIAASLPAQDANG